ncbi:unannotated protein [freshwater metagenome]|uniref:Unannotated protein n=1 Tax=freshwater metagenome TaxID=449393 RepID=A0A6J7NY93_9ZZZZ
MSASITDPSDRRTRSTRPSPSSVSTPTPRRRSTSCSRCRSAIRWPMSGPSTRPSGTGSASTIVTSMPRPRAVAATSAPMNPAPMTTTLRGAASNAERNARASSMVRNVKTPARPSVPGNRRGVDPVAMSNPSTTDDVPSSRLRVRDDRSNASARTPSFSSRPRPSSASPPMSESRPSSQPPARNCFDSGGRSYGAWGSSPMSVIGPSNPSRRNVSAARMPASDAPTMVTAPRVIASLMRAS